MRNSLTITADLKKMNPRSAAGFTLIEVVIAVTLLGVAYAAILGAFSGSLKLLRQASEYQNAMLLARSKLDETALDTALDIVDKEAEEKYGNITYAYKMEIRPVPLVEPALAEKVKLPVKLEEITVEVYWGKGGNERRYKLTSYKMSRADPSPPPPPANPGGSPPASPPVAPAQGKTP